MSRFDCTETFRRLDAYLDRELGPEEMALVEEHLAECANCAREFVVERNVLDGIKEKLRRIKAPETLLRRINEALRAEGQA